MNTRNGLRYAATGAVTETRYREVSRAVTTPNLTLPARNTLWQAQGNAFTGQYSYVSGDATDLGSSGFGLMFYQSRWYAQRVQIPGTHRGFDGVGSSGVDL